MTEISQGSILEPLLNSFTNCLAVLKSLILINSVEQTKLIIRIKSEVCWDIFKKNKNNWSNWNRIKYWNTESSLCTEEKKLISVWGDQWTRGHILQWQIERSWLKPQNGDWEETIAL